MKTAIEQKLSEKRRCSISKNRCQGIEEEVKGKKYYLLLFLSITHIYSFDSDYDIHDYNFFP